MIRPQLLHGDYPTAISGETTPRTVGVHDINTFAALTGDYSRIHLDDDFGAHLPFGGRIAHGLLSTSWALGALSLDAGVTVGRRNPLAWVSGLEVNYRAPVRPGDTLRCCWRSARQDSTGRDFGAARTDFQVLNQANDCVTDGHLFLQLPTDAASGPRLPPPPPVWPESTFRIEPGRAYYLEDLHAGSLAGQTEGRTLTEADVVGYGNFTGDYGVHHGDAERAARGLFGARIVQPMLAFDIGFALWLREWSRAGSPEGAGTAGHLCDRWTFHAPLYLGDTLRCRFQTLTSRVSQSRTGVGLVTCGLQLINQRTEVAMSSETVLMYPMRPAPDG
ncbi:MAG: hypothetical protein IT480_13750 [Gammaproteobacteria bacterium]|nr:hypothetical protein [Gammaproteobacteria bacterium]